MICVPEQELLLENKQERQLKNIYCIFLIHCKKCFKSSYDAIICYWWPLQ